MALYVIWQIMPAIQTYSYKIGSFHADAAGHLFIHQLLNFFQDAAHNHADGFGFGQKQLVGHDLFWVLSRLTIEISALPKHGDEIKLSTWVKSIRGSISEREFSVSLGDEVLVNASSLWFCLSGQSHKPARLPSDFINLMEINDHYATLSGSAKVADTVSDGPRSKGLKFSAHYSDIDMVDHVNNATYVRWVIDEIPVDNLQKNTIYKMDINYLGESFTGDKVSVFHTKLDESNMLHSVAKSDGDKVICRIHSSWQ